MASLGGEGGPGRLGNYAVRNPDHDQDGPQWLTFNIGDSRAYLPLLAVLFSSRRTTRHFKKQRICERTGADLVLPPRMSSLGALESRAMPELPWPIRPHPYVCEYDVVLVCSDGVHGVLSNDILSTVSDNASRKKRQCPV